MSADMIRRWVSFAGIMEMFMARAMLLIPSTRDSKKRGLREVSFSSARLESIADVLFLRWYVVPSISSTIFVTDQLTVKPCYEQAYR